MATKPDFSIALRLLKYAYSSKKKAYPIYLRIKLPGIPRYFEKTDVYVEQLSQWDKKAKKVKSHKNAVYLNKILSDLKNEQETILLENCAQGRTITRATTKRKEITSFYEYMAGVVSAKKAKTEKGRIERFFKREPSIHEIDYEWLRRYYKHQKDIWEDAAETINGTFRVLRTVTNVAVAEGYIKKAVLGIGVGKFPVPKGGSEIPVFLIEKEREVIFKAWARGDVKDPGLYKTLTYYLLACHSGLRFGDLEAFDVKTKVIGDMIALRASKNGKLVTYPIGESLIKILQVIRKIGPLSQDYDLYNNKNLKKLQEFFKQEKYNIDKEWGRSHIGRHSFGRFMAEQKVSKEHCAYFMGIGVKVVEIYYHTCGDLIVEQNKQLRAA